MPDDLKDFILWIFEASLDAQLRAVRRLRSGRPEPATARRLPGLSQVDLAYDILKRARTPFPISELLASSIHFTFHLTVDRESLVSSLSKKIVRADRFIRTDRKERPSRNLTGVKARHSTLTRYNCEITYLYSAMLES